MMRVREWEWKDNYEVRSIWTLLYRMIKFASHDNITLQKKKIISNIFFRSRLFNISISFSLLVNFHTVFIVNLSAKCTEQFNSHITFCTLCSFFCCLIPFYFGSVYDVCVNVCLMCLFSLHQYQYSSSFIKITAYRNNEAQQLVHSRSISFSSSLSIWWKGRRMKVVFL